MNRSAFMADKKGDIRRLLEINGEFKQMDLNALADTFIINAKLENIPKIDQIRSIFIKKMTEGYNSEELRELTVRAYNKTYTHSQILDLIKFFESPLGQIFIGKTIETQAELSKMVSVWVNERMQGINVEIMKILEQSKNEEVGMWQ